ncbi:TetR/AcrR family transcriptional regulator [Streptomyces sp. SP18CS02]|uniref:TetR/AcrR family transcriptional regulator n=1 Tax=Streptomyces sp. SP18CS02 TaxID=3002531 RepID=UPI002E7887E6|nr:TetR family transcriptional regulator [Streptomyces sp. SP18CS02]MEE1755254.1 TetR family transcriptional regulator [Streptomyces sp. SP18CS02]
MSEVSPPSGGLRERKKRATRAALVAAAMRLAAEQGAEHVTVDAISEAAGVSPRTFFNYFDTRDDVFVMVGAESNQRVRDAVRAASPDLTPLRALRDAIAAELDEVEQQQELWRLHAEVLRKSPHLLARSIGAHLADELGLATALAERIGADSPPLSADPAVSPQDEEDRRRALGLYPRLLAAVGTTAVRVAIEHWCLRREEVTFTEVFRETFDHLAAGLPAPSPRGTGKH